MKNIIEGMYYGSVLPFGEQHIRTHGYADCVKKLFEAEAEVLNAFPECRELLNRYTDAQTELSSTAAYEQFLLGFRAGAKIMMEMLK